MKNLLPIGVLAAVTVVGGMAFAERAEASWMNGHQLAQHCGTDEVFSIALCSGYLMGVIDTLDRDHITLTGRPCTPEDDQILDHRATTMRYLADSQSQLDRGAHYLVINAVISEFQCSDDLSFPG